MYWLTIHRLYGIVVVMTMLMFGLNIEQVCLLPVISNLYWIVLFPGVIFIAFMAWAFLSVTSNRSVFFGQLGSVGEGSNRAFQHLKALFVLQGRSQRSYAYDNSAPSCTLSQSTLLLYSLTC